MVQSEVVFAASGDFFVGETRSVTRERSEAIQLCGTEVRGPK
jgi:hypothetical protein